MSDEKTRAPLSRAGTRMLTPKRRTTGEDLATRVELDLSPPRAPGFSDDLLASVRETPAARLQAEEPIAKGGMGAVERVYDRGLARRVAKKTIHKILRDHEGMVRMFLREARIGALL